jgi:hypothetical protein
VERPTDSTNLCHWSTEHLSRNQIKTSHGKLNRETNAGTHKHSLRNRDYTISSFLFKISNIFFLIDNYFFSFPVTRSEEKSLGIIQAETKIGSMGKQSAVLTDP